MLSPSLDKRFLKPENLEFKGFVTPDGVQHRYAVARVENAKGTIVLLHGFSEFIEKFFELIRDLNAAGYHVYSFDWRGQGKSARYFPDNIEQVYHDGFDKDAQNLRYFVETVVPHDLPRFALAHSMGGHITMLTLHAYPDLFQAAALSAPMVAFPLPYPRWLARIVLNVMRLFRLQKRTVGEGGHWRYKAPPLENDPRSRDPERRLVQYKWCEADEGLRMGDITFQWVYHALKSVITLGDKGFLEGVKTPLLIGKAEMDQIVDNAAIDRAARRLPNARVVTLKGAQHELLMERDHIRDEFLSETLAFFEQNR